MVSNKPEFSLTITEYMSPWLFDIYWWLNILRAEFITFKSFSDLWELHSDFVYNKEYLKLSATLRLLKGICGRICIWHFCFFRWAPCSKTCPTHRSFCFDGPNTEYILWVKTILEVVLWPNRLKRKSCLRIELSMSASYVDVVVWMVCPAVQFIFRVLYYYQLRYVSQSY